MKIDRKFWKTVKPYLSDKSVSSESKTTEVLNNVFSNIFSFLRC